MDVSIKNIFSQKKSGIFAGLFLIIMIGGIFLRVYHYSDWLRFNADQSRDATVVSAVIEGKSAWPLMGPKAGGTEFKLGPAFYYLQIIAAKTFGNSPDKMAYPDLLAGILTIPLIFLLSKRYFNSNIALILAFVASVSIFLVKYSRFAWNPNSGPFYTLLLLYALLMLVESKGKKQTWWIIAAGVALGIGVQLHTLLLIIMPIISVLFFVYVGRRYPGLWKKAAAIILVALFLNTGQIIDEVQTRGANINAFFGGASAKTGKGSSLVENILNDASCQMQANAFIVSAAGNDDQCGTSLITGAYDKAHGLGNKAMFAFELLISVWFFLGGIYFWIMAIGKEKDENKKLMLQLTGAYALVGFLLLIPLANEISLRFYLAIIFVPFMLLGFWIENILDYGKQYRKYAIAAVAIIIFLIAGNNLLAIKTAFADYVGIKQISGSTKSEITLGEVKFLANYILVHAQPKSTVLVEGKQKYLFKYLKSIEYFTKKNDIKVEALSKKIVPKDEVLVSVGNAKNKGKLTAKLSETYSARDVELYGRFSIAVLTKK